MRKVKKIIFIALGCVALMVAAACSGGHSENEPSTGENFDGLEDGAIETPIDPFD